MELRRWWGAQAGCGVHWEVLSSLQAGCASSWG